MCLFLVHRCVASKIETKEKMEFKLKLNLSSDDVRNYKETTALVKESNTKFGVKTRTFIHKIQRAQQV